MTGAVLWDLDGTLVDSTEYHWRAWVETLEPEGFFVTREQFLATFGQRNDLILPDWLGGGATAEQVRRIGDDKEARYRVLVQREGLEALPGAKEWLERLRSEGWLQAIASSAPRLNVEVMLEAAGLDGYFEAVVSGEDVEKGKPDPQVFLAAAAKLGMPAARCIVVEDAQAGIEAARRAGMRSIGLSRGGADLPADVTIQSLAELAPDAFRSLLSPQER